MFVKIDFEIKPEAPPLEMAPALFTIINLQCAKPSRCQGSVLNTIFMSLDK